MNRRKISVSKEEIIEMVSEAVSKKICNIVESHSSSRKHMVSESQLIEMVMNEIKNFDDIPEEDIYGSSNYDIVDEYEAADYDTVMNTISDHGWHCEDYGLVVSPTKRKAVRYFIEQRPDCSPISKLMADLKSRCIRPEGVMALKGGKIYDEKIQPYYIVSYIYNN